MHKIGRAFTLVEMLVVLAIVAALTAILFPVFIAAKNTAKKVVCANNFRQAFLAGTMYVADYDDTYMPVNHQPAEAPNSKNDRTWVQMLLPYLREYNVFKCPSDTSLKQGSDASFDQDLIPGDVYSRYYTASLHTNLGYNFLYLAPVVRGDSNWYALPRIADQVSQPSSMLMFVDSVWDRDANGNPIGGGSWLVVPPCRYKLTASGQMVDSFQVGGRDVYSPQGWTTHPDSSALRYGRAWPWHQGRITVIRVDGSATTLSPAELAAGCTVQDNWQGYINNTSYAWGAN